MNVLAYYRARQRGLDPSEAADEAGGADPLADTTPPDDSTPDSTPDVPASQPPNAMSQPFTPPGPPPMPPPAPPMVQAPAAGGVSQQLAAALQRARQRRQMPTDIGDDALSQSMQADEKARAGDKFTESLRAAFARQSPNFNSIDSGPSAATKALQLKRQTFQQGASADSSEALREAALLKGAEPKPIDPSLAALHEASALNLRGLEAQRATEEKRRQDETQRKNDATTVTKGAESASVEAQRAVLAADQRLKRLGVTPDTLAKLDRKGIEDVQRELAGRFGAGAAGAPHGGGHRLPATSLKELGDLDAADAQLAHLEEQAKAADIGSLKNSAVSMLPERLKANTEIGRYEDAARAAMQSVGVILEHGKLAAGDETKYRRMLPEPGDDVPTLSHKISELRGYLKELKARHTGAYSQGGYEVPDAGGGETKTGSDGKQYRKNARGKWESVGG